MQTEENGQPRLGAIEKSEKINELATALCAAQGELGAVKRDGTNPHFGSTFASLEEIIRVIDEPLHSNGLSYLQLQVHAPEIVAVRWVPGEEGKPGEQFRQTVHQIGLMTILTHVSGQWIGAIAVLPFDIQKGRTTVQAAGSTTSYMRRYGLLSLLGLATEDDDGNTTGARTGASAATGARPGGKSGGGGANGAVTEPQCRMFRALTRKLDLSDEAIARGFADRGFTAVKFEELTRKQASEVLDALKARENESG